VLNTPWVPRTTPTTAAAAASGAVQPSQLRRSLQVMASHGPRAA